MLAAFVNCFFKILFYKFVSHSQELNVRDKVLVDIWLGPKLPGKEGKGGKFQESKYLKVLVKKLTPKKPKVADDDDITYNINAISTNQTPNQEAHWTLDNCATGHVTGVRHYVNDCHGDANLILHCT